MAMVIALFGLLWPLMALASTSIICTVSKCLQFKNHALRWDFESFLQESALIAKENKKCSECFSCWVRDHTGDFPLDRTEGRDLHFSLDAWQQHFSKRVPPPLSIGIAPIGVVRPETEYECPLCGFAIQRSGYVFWMIGLMVSDRRYAKDVPLLARQAFISVVHF